MNASASTTEIPKSCPNHPVLVISDDSIPVDVIVGRTWLKLPHISYYKRQDELVIETINIINSTALSESVSEESTDVYAALVSADKPMMTPLATAYRLQDWPGYHWSRTRQFDDAQKRVSWWCSPRRWLNSVVKMWWKWTLTRCKVPSDSVRQKPYRTSQTDRYIRAQILDEWKSTGIISNSTSPYASPVNLVNKGTGEKRLCVDYRRLNHKHRTNHIRCRISMTYDSGQRRAEYSPR